MTGALLDRMPLDRDELDALGAYSTFMSVHQIYEVVSDNLAIGLAGPGLASRVGPVAQEREEILRSFNPAAAESLSATDCRLAQAAFAAWESLARGISAFRNSNNEAEHRALAEAYGREHPGEDLSALEFSVAPCLLANITSGLSMADVVRDLATWDLFITGLARRYTAVQRLLTERPTEVEALLSIGTDSIMVVSTIAYYTGLINEVVRPLPGYRKVLDDGSVQRLLADAALLVRLVNDVGTRLLEQAPQDRRQLVARLRASADAARAEDLEQVLWQAQAAEGALLTRLKKDVGFGEFNVCLDGIRHLPAHDGLAHFEDRLDRVTSLYQRTLGSLAMGAAELRARTGSSLVGGPALRFVHFHQELYRKTFDDQMGDYAVALNSPSRGE
ncbi:hypothetical protein [Streptomyces sp. NPDC054849]